ncbi:MAG TPA: ATP-binding protein [Tepidisphaeraceae bacterium]|nr:ATP-binding protein [Tepidisphaeraceae bacterium]
MAKREVKMTIASDYSEARKAHREIMGAVDASGFNESSTFAIKLALEEVLMNAIKHGNQCDPAKNVRIEAVISPRQFELTVEDEGRGFDPAEVPDPRTEENLEKIHGRGLLLMRSYMDEVEYTRGGRRVRMVKKNREEAPHPPPC